MVNVDRQPIVEERVRLPVLAGLRALERQRDPMPEPCAPRSPRPRPCGRRRRDRGQRRREQNRGRERGASGRSSVAGRRPRAGSPRVGAESVATSVRRRKEWFAARPGRRLVSATHARPERIARSSRCASASARPYDDAIAAARTCYSPRVIGADEVTPRPARDDRPAHLRGRPPHGLPARALRVRPREREPPVRVVVPALAPVLQLGAVQPALRAPRRGARATCRTALEARRARVYEEAVDVGLGALPPR